MKALLFAVGFVVLLGCGLTWLASSAGHSLQGLWHQLVMDGTGCAEFVEKDTTHVFACDTTGLQTVPGYRFVLEGDFNGDGKKRPPRRTFYRWKWERNR